MYQCPYCNSSRAREERGKDEEGNLILTVNYEAGCQMKLRYRKGIWKLIYQNCKKATM